MYGCKYVCMVACTYVFMYTGGKGPGMYSCTRSRQICRSVRMYVYEAEQIVCRRGEAAGTCVRSVCVLGSKTRGQLSKGGPGPRSVTGSAYARPLDTPILGAEWPLWVTVKSIIISANIWTWTQGRPFTRNRLSKLSELAPNNILIVVDGVERVTLRVR
jgi:hypothetical protein